MNKFIGDYQTWQSASEASKGYQAQAILAGVQAAARKVLRGEARYDRDEAVFDDDEQRWPLVAGLLLHAAIQSKDAPLKVMDVGGGLGCTYRQVRQVVEPSIKLHWSVIEQPSFCAAGRAEFETETLRFHSSIAACVERDKPSVALLSSVLPYVEDPHGILRQVLSLRLPLVMIDRTPLIQGARDRLTVQHVPEAMGGGSYPAWFLSQRRLEQALLDAYRIVSAFDGLDSTFHLFRPFDSAPSRGYILVRR